MPAVVWWEIETPAPEAFQSFHAAMWGWEFRPAFTTELEADYWIIESAGHRLGGLQRAATTDRPHPGTRLYVEVEDLEATLVRAASLGARAVRGRTALGDDGRWFATFVDPGGVPFGLWTTTSPADEIVVADVVPALPARVWVALTTQRSMWWPELSFDPAPGAELVDRARPARGTVTVVDREERLAFTWAHEDAQSSTHVTITLSPQGAGTLLTITEAGPPDVLPDRGPAWRRHLARLREHLR